MSTGEPTNSTKTAVEPLPAWTTPECERVRTAAAEARTNAAWVTLLGHIRRTECWRTRTERIRLHVKALAELNRWEECARIGKGYRDRLIRQQVRLCTSRLARGGS
jgi:hypothetical protein